MSVLHPPPPAAWFFQPEPDQPLPLTMQPDRRFIGHAWAPTPDEGLLRPRDVNYDLFHCQPITTADAGTVHVGPVFLKAEPVDLSMSAEQAIAHYRATGVVVAHVRVVEGRFGLWLSGVAAPDVDEHIAAQVRERELLGSWWKVDGRMSLISLVVRPPDEHLDIALLVPTRDAHERCDPTGTS